MKKIYFTFLLVSTLLPAITSAQQMQWLQSTPINYNLNPEMPRQPICISGDHIYAAKMVSFGLSYGIDIYGGMSIDQYDSSGVLLWSFSMNSKLVVNVIKADVSGNVIVSGSFMETLQLNGTDSLLNTGNGFNTNLFLLSLDGSGNLLWKRNVTIDYGPDAQRISSFALDQGNSFWYSLEYFDSVSIKKLDINGNDLQSYIVHGTRTLGGMSFDASGNLFLTGSTGSQSIIMNGFSVAVSEPYMMFIARINASGNTSWIQPVHDVTFQSPRIVATASGNAYVSGNLMDSTSFGSVHLDGPQWVYDIFLVKVDSSGNFSWGVEVPETPNIAGDFQIGKDNFVDIDASENVYINGSIRGSVDWGNGVITDAGQIPSAAFSIVSFNSNGIAQWQITGGAPGFATPYSTCIDGNGNCYFSASSVGTFTMDSHATNQGGNNFAFVMGKTGATATTGIDIFVSNETLNVYPNPADNKLGVSSRQFAIYPVSIYNVMGEKVLTKFSGEKTYRYDYILTEIDISDFPSGIYFLQSGNARTKFIIQHD